MDSLHTILRAIRTDTSPESKSSTPDHLTVFREFLAHLDAVQRKAQGMPAAKPAAAKSPRAKPAKRRVKKHK